MKIAEPDQQSQNKAGPKPQVSGLARFGWIGVLLLGFAAFSPALFHYFTGEDFVFIKSAADGQAFYDTTQRLFYRPLPNLLWQADYTLWKLGASGYHLTNLLLHLLNALLTGLLARKLSGKSVVGYLAATLFALHPVHIEAVEWLASRPDLLATSFCLVSALTGLSFFSRLEISNTKEFSPTKRSSWLYLISVAAFGAGLFSKEAGAGLPIALFGIILWQNRGRGWQRLLLWLLPYFGVGLLYGLARYAALGGLGGYTGTGRGLIYVAWNLTGGLWLPLLFPINLESAGTGVSVALVAVLLVIYGGLLWRFFANRATSAQKLPWLPALIFIYGCLLPALNTAPVDTNMAQSRILYLPSVGFCLLLALFLYQGFFRSSFPFIVHRSSFILILLFLWQIIVLQINLAPWQQAGEVVRQTFGLLSPYNLPLADGDTIYFKGLPDSYRGAYGWRNGLEDAVSLVTNHKLGGFNRTPDLKVDYRLTDSGKLWFLQYQYDPDRANLALSTVYNAGPEQVFPVQTQANWDFANCNNNAGWDWNPGTGQLQCLNGRGLQFDTLGKKTGVLGYSPVLKNIESGQYYVDITAYINFDFEQPAVVGDAYLLDATGKQELAYLPFDFAADGRGHSYRLYLKPSRPADSVIVMLKASKMRSNMVWQRVAFGAK